MYKRQSGGGDGGGGEGGGGDGGGEGGGGGAGGMEDGYAGPGGSGSQLGFSINIDKTKDWMIFSGEGGHGGTYKEGRYSNLGRGGTSGMAAYTSGGTGLNEDFSGGDGGYAGNHGIDGGGSGSGGGGGGASVLLKRNKSGQSLTEQESINSAVYFGLRNNLFTYQNDAMEVFLNLRYYNMAMDNSTWPTSAKNEESKNQYKTAIVEMCERNNVKILEYGSSSDRPWRLAAAAGARAGGTGRKELNAYPGKGGDPSPFERAIFSAK